MYTGEINTITNSLLDKSVKVTSLTSHDLGPAALTLAGFDSEVYQ